MSANILTSSVQHSSTKNFKAETFAYPDSLEKHKEKIENLVKREVMQEVSHLVQELLSHEKYFDDLNQLVGFKGEDDDEDQDCHEILEYWLVTPWLGCKLKDHGEQVVEFLDLVIWGRQTTGQCLVLDGVFNDIAKNY